MVVMSSGHVPRQGNKWSVFIDLAKRSGGVRSDSAQCRRVSWAVCTNKNSMPLTSQLQHGADLESGAGHRIHGPTNRP